MDAYPTIERELPSLPPEVYTSKISKWWAKVKRRIHANGEANQSTVCEVPWTYRRTVGRSKAKVLDYQSLAPLPYSVYYSLLDSNVSYVLPGLREQPPPVVENDDEIRSLEPVRQPQPSTDYTPIDDMSKDSSQRAPLRLRHSVSLDGRPTGSVTGLSSLATSVQSLHLQAWYWGPLNRKETERKLAGKPDGSFLVRDSTNTHHLYSLSFKQNGRLFHTRIEFIDGLFTFFTTREQAMKYGKTSVEELIEFALADGLDGEFSSQAGVASEFERVSGLKILLRHPVSRNSHVCSLQYLCKFVLRANMNRLRVNDLPLPAHLKEWLSEGNFFKPQL